MQDSFEERRFQGQVDAALDKVRTILHTSRQPNYPDQVFHKYEDKYHLVDFLTNTALAAEVNCLEFIGVSPKHLQTLREWGKDRSVTLRLKVEERCTFDRQQERKVESPEYVTETKGVFGTSTKSEKVVTTVTDYFWKFDSKFELYAFKGNNPDEKVTLTQRSGSFEILTSSKSTPKPESVIRPSLDLNITWLLAQVKEGPKFGFQVNRLSDDCHTPRRNSDVESAISHFRSIYTWTSQVHAYFTALLFPVQTNHGLDLSKINDRDVFMPVVPLFEEPKEQEEWKETPTKYFGYADPFLTPSTATALVALTPLGEETKTVSLPVDDLNLFLAEQQRTLKEKFVELEQMFPDDKRLITHNEAKILVAALNIQRVCQHYVDGVNYVEHLLKKQLIAAIGKTVTPVDFTNYMVYHGRKIFKEEYAPQLFSYAVRQPDHFPEGTVGIDAHLDDGSPASPIYTLVRRSSSSSSDPDTKPMRFPINAATNVSFYGDRYLHAYVSHQFSGQSGSSLSLVARARQFSSFILLVGTITGAGLFEAKQALVIQNKDDLKVPLMIETIPSAKEFKDAIESLSPEQQRFAKAFRRMQLASTLFGFVVLQIKPQLEKLLKLPHDSLNKEIRLTQDLLELFMKYQIPSDLLSYDGDSKASNADKVADVKKNVKAMQDMIEETRQKQLASQQQSNLFNLGNMIQTLIPSRKYEKSTENMKDKMQSAMKKNKVASGVKKSLAKEAKPAPSKALDKTAEKPADKSTRKIEVVEKPEREDSYGDEESEEGEDYTQVPEALDAKFEKLDSDGALRPTIISPSAVWTKDFLPSLLATPATRSLGRSELEEEKNKAFDLIDALSRSGALPFDHASLHVVIGCAHCFDKDLLNTIIQDNINPVEKLERSLLIISSTILEKPSHELIKEEHVQAVSTYSPLLFVEEKKADVAKLLEKEKDKEKV